jgi:hypothetical protein
LNGLIGWLLAVSVAVFLGGMIVMPLLVARMRPDYFVRRRPTADSWSGRHQGVRWIVFGLKNLLGVILLITGVAMFFLPGPGVITILVGLTLVNFPGKRRLELRIVRQRPVLRAINWMREKSGQPPLELPADDAETD